MFRLSYKNAGQAAELVNQVLRSRFVQQAAQLQKETTIQLEPLKIQSETSEIIPSHFIQIDHFLTPDEAQSVAGICIETGRCLGSQYGNREYT